MAILTLAPAWCATTLRYWVEPCTDAESSCRAGDVELAQWAVEAWQAASGGKLVLEKSAKDRAQIRVYWAGGRAGLYGEARPIVVDGVRGAEVYVLPVTDSDPLMRDAVVYLT